MKLLKMSNFTLFHKVFYAICILKSLNSYISVVICSFFEFGTGVLGNELKSGLRGKGLRVIVLIYNNLANLPDSLNTL